jgi:SPP1 family predicted phage head-tail adaptor
LGAEVLTMQPGRLRDRITIQAPVKTTDALGAPARAWADIWACAAKIEVLRGREYFGGQREEAAGDWRITFRHPPRSLSITSDCRILDVRHDVTYCVVGLTFDPKRSWLSAVCVSGVSDG